MKKATEKTCVLSFTRQHALCGNKSKIRKTLNCKPLEEGNGKNSVLSFTRQHAYSEMIEKRNLWRHMNVYTLKKKRILLTSSFVYCTVYHFTPSKGTKEYEKKNVNE